jgi:hypothetical protein
MTSEVRIWEVLGLPSGPFCVSSQWPMIAVAAALD